MLVDRAICLLTVLALLVAAGHVCAQGNPQEGHAVALQVCSECHAIQKGQARSPNARSPTFVELANTPGMTATALSVALSTPHAGMPMFILTTEQKANIIAHILSLKE